MIFRGFLSNFRALVFMPEMRVFWFFLPFLILLLVLNAVLLQPPYSYASIVLLLAVTAVVFFASLRAARTSFFTTVERNELKSVIQGLQDALIVYDQDFKITYFNPAAERLFRLPAREVMGHEIKPQAVEKPLTRLLAQIIYPSLAPSLVIRTKPGEYPQIADLSFDDPELELQVATAPVADNRGRLLGFMKIARDRTREVTLIKSKEEFVAIASHQLRTPITELNWALETIAQDRTLQAETKNLVDRTAQSAKELLSLVEDLLSISRIEEGRFGYALAETDIVAFVEKILEQTMPLAEEAGLKLYFDRPKEKLPPVIIDSSKLGMAMNNLIDNAIRYNVPNGQITVKVARAAEGPFLEISVKDTGIGLPAEEIDKLFHKFYRGTNALKFQTNGSGLGLYISRNIILAHGGRMWAESELNRGSTFTFTLPTDSSLVPTKEVALE